MELDSGPSEATRAGRPATVLVTGGGSGVGRAAAVALAAAGFQVAVCGRRPEPLEETAALIRGAGGAPEPFAAAADVRDPAAVAALFQRIQHRFGRLDVLFNNAGVNAPPATPDQLTWDDWRKVLSVNLDGAFLCAQHAFALMRRQNPQGGRIINNGSVSAYAPRPGSAAYTASKHAITGLTKSLELDGRPFDIACSQIDIGNASTQMTRKMADGVPQADGGLAVEPTMDVVWAARTVVYLAQLPLSANIPFVTIKATKMPLYGRG